MLSKKQCAVFLDGALQDHKAYVSGIYKDYPIVCYETNSRSIQIINIPASSVNDPEGNGLKSFLNGLLPLYKQFKTAEADGHSVTLTFVVEFPKKFVEIAGDIVTRVVGFLEQNGYTAGCSHCGNMTGAELYQLNDSYLWLCPDCAAEYNRELEGQKIDTKAQRSNLVPGLVGAVLGALIGAALYVVIYQLGYIAGICGLVMAILALKFYEKLGGCLDLKGVIASIAVVLIMVFVANKFAWAFSAYSALKEEGASFFDCYRNLNSIIELSELKRSYISELAVAYLISVVGCLRSFINAIKGSTGSFSFKKLDS